MQAEALDFVGHASDRGMTGNLSGDAGVRLVFPAGEKQVRRALSTAMGALAGMGLSDDARGLAEIVLAEVLNNVVEHAYAAQRPGLIEIDAWLEGAFLWMKVQDDGFPMPDGVVPKRRDQDVTGAAETLPEGGFGWSIIHELSHDLTYERDGLRNTVTFSLDLEELEATP